MTLRSKLLFFSLSVLFLLILSSCGGSGEESADSDLDGEGDDQVVLLAGAERWSDRTTWGGRKPKAGEVVVIPAGKTVLLNENPPKLGGLEINGTLILSRRKINLRTGWITVNGRLEIGTETDPFKQRAVITLDGRPGSDPLGREGGIRVMMGGIVDIHGAVGKISWTRLAQTASAGKKRLVLQVAPGWRPGDRIVIASTDFDMNQAEEKSIVAVNGNVVTLGSRLAYTHWGATENGVEERAEVGLLSRNILIQGDDASTGDGKGGHLMAMAGGTLRVSGVEFYRMGRKGELGRYPVHFHMMGEAAGSYVKESAIHHSYNRAVTIHGSHNTVVQGNVAYDTLGHSYFFEDGIETGNLLENNLGLLTRRPPADSQILASDVRPATFWVSNPDNTLRGNAATGSEGFGFWYDLPLHPTGLSATDTVFPRNVPLREFTNNVAHSNGEDGLFFDAIDGSGIYQPRMGGQPSGAPVWVSMTNFITFKNRTRGIWIRGDHIVVQGAKIADNETGVTFAGSYNNNDTNFKNSIVIGETANKGTPLPGENTGMDGRSLPHPMEPGRPIRGFEYYDGMVGIAKITFANFLPNSQRKAGALGDLRYNQFPLDPRNYTSSIAFVDANQVYFDSLGASTARPNDEDGHRSMVFIDHDGSVTGSMGYAVVVNNPFLIDTSCNFMSGWNAFACPYSYGGLVIFNNDSPPGSIAPLSITREENGAVQTLAGSPGASRYQFNTNLIDKRNYSVIFGGSAPQSLRLLYHYRQGGDWIQIAVPYPYAQFKVYRDGDFTTPLVSVNSVAQVSAGTGNVYYYDAVSQTLHLKLMVRSDIPGRDYAIMDIVP